MNCDTCGAPDWSVGKDDGHTLIVKVRAENSYRRDSKRTVWVCCDECAIQALGISKYGPSTRHWPVSLAKFRATKPLEAR